MSWGWNPDSIGAAATAVAAVAAVVAGVFAAWAYRSEREARRLAAAAHALAVQSHDAERARESRDLADRRRAQAEMVSAWAVVTDETNPTLRVCVQNLSPAPVYFVSAGLVLKNAQSRYAKWVRVLPTTTGSPASADVKEGAVNAWRAWVHGRRPAPLPLVEFTFRDARGVWWFRDGDGVLHEITEAERWRYGADAANESEDVTATH